MAKSSVRHLDHHEALNAGAQVWIIPEPALSKWARTIDWHLNFQVYKARNREALKTNENVERIVRDLQVIDVETDAPLKENADTPILVASRPHLPTDMVVVLPWSKRLSTWTSDMKELAKTLKAESVRVFLPDREEDEGEKLERAAEKALKGEASGIDFEIVKTWG